MSDGGSGAFRRGDGRGEEELRPIRLERGFNRYAEGSCLIRQGNTHVHCTVSLEERVPSFLKGSGQGWITAEYSLLPRSTHTRTPREIARGKPNARGTEIQRLIGRALRAAVDLRALGERTLWVDCDVLQADGGTRTAAITGGFVALVDALRVLRDRGGCVGLPLRRFVAAVSVGKVGGRLLTDLHYEEDSVAEADLNVVATDRGEYVEIQGTGEGGVFTRPELDGLLDRAATAIREIQRLQWEALRFDPEEVIGLEPELSRLGQP